MEAVFRQCAEEERARGRTVLLSSHILSEVEALCDRVTIIRAGRTVETGTLAELRHLTRTSIAAELAGLPQRAGPRCRACMTWWWTRATARAGSRVRCEVDSDQLDELLRLLVAAGVRTLVSQPPTLEELFLRHYAADAADPADAGGSGRRAARRAAGVSAAPAATGPRRRRPAARRRPLAGAARADPAGRSAGTGSCCRSGSTLLTAIAASGGYGLKSSTRPRPAGRRSRRRVGTTPALAFLYGQLHGNSLGALTAWRYLAYAALGAALMSIFLVVRHTRADEEAGRLELVGSTVVGRHAPLAVAHGGGVRGEPDPDGAQRGGPDRQRAAGQPGRSPSVWPRAAAGWCSPRVAAVAAQVSEHGARRQGAGDRGARARSSCCAASATRPAPRPDLADLAVADRLGGAGPAVRRPSGGGCSRCWPGRRPPWPGWPSRWPRGAIRAPG